MGPPGRIQLRHRCFQLAAAGPLLPGGLIDDSLVMNQTRYETLLLESWSCVLTQKWATLISAPLRHHASTLASAVSLSSRTRSCICQPFQRVTWNLHGSSIRQPTLVTTTRLHRCEFATGTCHHQAAQSYVRRVCARHLVQMTPCACSQELGQDPESELQAAIDASLAEASNHPAYWGAFPSGACRTVPQALLLLPSTTCSSVRFVLTHLCDLRAHRAGCHVGDCS